MVHLNDFRKNRFNLKTQLAGPKRSSWLEMAQSKYWNVDLPLTNSWNYKPKTKTLVSLPWTMKPPHLSSGHEFIAMKAWALSLRDSLSLSPPSLSLRLSVRVSLFASLSPWNRHESLISLSPPLSLRVSLSPRLSLRPSLSQVSLALFLSISGACVFIERSLICHSLSWNIDGFAWF